VDSVRAAPPQAPPIDAEHASRLWRPVVAAAGKGKLTPPREAELLLGDPDPDALDRACALLQTWCWLRGLPPLDRLVAFPRTQGAVRPVMDYEPFFHALGFDVHTERVVMAYPWTKVREPTPDELLQGQHVVAANATTIAAFRFLDLELDLNERDAARGKRRAVPDRHRDWAGVKMAWQKQVTALEAQGMRLGDLRPPGLALYPPPAPRALLRDD
jgi:hypothetical protein